MLGRNAPGAGVSADSAEARGARASPLCGRPVDARRPRALFGAGLVRMRRPAPSVQRYNDRNAVCELQNRKETGNERVQRDRTGCQ